MSRHMNHDPSVRFADTSPTSLGRKRHGVARSQQRRSYHYGSSATARASNARNQARPRRPLVARLQ
jgi:hypothetical protein